MAFLDNSGDIILDAVLTDTGRFRLAKGDGSFKITKFALGDEEINYGSYDKNNASGSAYYDLAILQTPILEAFTNNTSTMQTKLISIPRTNLLYLPVMRLSGPQKNYTSGSTYGGNFVVCVNLETAGNSTTTGILDGDQQTADDIQGFLNGYQPSGQSTGGSIRVDQGLDTGEIPSTYTIDADLNETQYIVEMDNRFGTIVSAGSPTVAANVSFIDDDNIASYYLSMTTDQNFIANIDGNSTESSISGPRGTSLEFKVQASTDLATSTYLFEQLGNSGYLVNVTGRGTDTTAYFICYYIDSIIKVTGATTGYTINIPVRYIRKYTSG